MYCGQVYDQHKQPSDCEFCRGLLVRVMKGRENDWREVGTPTSKRGVIRSRVGAVGRSQRARIFKRDGYRCVTCGTTRFSELTIDHRVPRSRGGRNEDANLQTMCRRCNVEKGDKMPEDC